MVLRAAVVFLGSIVIAAACQAAEIKVNNQLAELDIRPAGEHSIRVTLKPISFKPDFPFTPALAERDYPAPAISLREISRPVRAQIGGLNVEVLPTPLTIIAKTMGGKPIQKLVFQDNGNLSFQI